MRPCDSVTGTRCTRCTPPSNFSADHTPSGSLARDRTDERDVLVAAQVGLDGVEHLGPPAAALGVAQVHPQQVAGEQRRLLAALPGLDLQHARRRRRAGRAGRAGRARRRLEHRDARGDLGGLRGEGWVLGGELAGRGLVLAGGGELAGCRDDRRQLGVAAAELARVRGVGVHGGVGEGALQLGVLREHRVEGRCAHRTPSLRSVGFAGHCAESALASSRAGRGRCADDSLASSLIGLVLRTCGRRPPRGDGRRVETLLRAGRPLAVPGLEAGDAAAGVEDLLLAGVERVAGRADLDVDGAAVLGAAGGELVAAAAVDVVSTYSG